MNAAYAQETYFVMSSHNVQVQKFCTFIACGFEIVLSIDMSRVAVIIGVPRQACRCGGRVIDTSRALANGETIGNDCRGQGKDSKVRWEAVHKRRRVTLPDRHKLIEAGYRLRSVVVTDLQGFITLPNTPITLFWN